MGTGFEPLAAQLQLIQIWEFPGIYGCFRDLHVGLSLLLIGGKVNVVRLPKGSPILNVLARTDDLLPLPDWSLTPATWVVTPKCVLEQLGSKTAPSYNTSFQIQIT